MAETLGALKARIAGIGKRLASAYPDAGCALVFMDPWECLVSTILSAQSTDRKVNEAAPALFGRFPGVKAFAKAEPSDVEPFIKVLGLYRAKAKNIVGSARAILSAHGGVVPDTIDELVKLPGVGRKTANCVVLNAYGKPGIMCDTHFCRITKRLGLHDLDDPDKIEFAVARLLPPERWGDFSHRVIVHGRECCHSRRPECPRCPLLQECPCGRAESTWLAGV
ncbi:MAG: endonuclease III [Planctomycetota bacterium]|jgi:endonuclease-3|nr:endonuclease III [Planctomycetota bacterium]